MFVAGPSLLTALRVTYGDAPEKRVVSTNDTCRRLL